MLTLAAAAALVAGYLLGRRRPLHRARQWAWWEVWVGKDPGRVKGAAIIALLPERFIPLVWHRIRHGAYPGPPPRRPAPAIVNRRRDSEETPRRLTEQQGGIPNDAYTADDYPKGM